MKAIILLVALLVARLFASGQGSPPWERPLLITSSTDGQNFSSSTIFQDSSGVPCMIRWKGDTLLCVFQWFRQPMNSPTWDKVAVKYSYDAGLTWTTPLPIVVNGLPASYQRPFDPTIVAINSDSIRIFFSSSDGYPLNGGDSIINTYSAISSDGLNYTFESNPRYDNSTQRVIDPAAIIFNGQWHYAAPIGAPQDGAFHCISADGINFTRQADYLSDMQHNWTGNFMLNDPGELRFYGSGQFLWYNSTTDGFNWNGYQPTNIIGGDPTVVRVDTNDFLMVYTGPPYATSVEERFVTFNMFPNPVNSMLTINASDLQGKNYSIYDVGGKMKMSGLILRSIDVSSLSSGFYFLIVKEKGNVSRMRFQKM